MITELFKAKDFFATRHVNLRDDLIFALLNGWYVIDGDTVLVLRDVGGGWLSKKSLRIKGIDAPELRSTLSLERETARAVADVVERWCYMAHADGGFQVQSGETDKYGRVIGDLTHRIHGSLSYFLLEAHIVRAYEGTTGRGAWSNRELRTTLNRAKSVYEVMPDHTPDHTWVLPAILKFMEKHDE